MLLFVPALLLGQQQPAPPLSDLQQILSRLDSLEQENRNLTAEVRALRAELAGGRPVAASAAPVEPASAPTVDEQVAVHERRIDELAQTKVESSQRMPISLTGMILFNAFTNGRASAGAEDPLFAAASSGHAGAGGTLSQSVIGLTFQGPRVLGGGQVTASALMDLWGGTPSNSLNHLIRLRTGNLAIQWKTRSLTFGQDKPLIAPRDPDSLAQVAFSPLSGAGNLWLWQPQVRFEQRVAMGDNMGLRAQAAIYQTSEPTASAGTDYAASLSPARPAFQGRFEFWRNLSQGARFEIAPGFHVSETHVAGVSVPSRIFSIDWLLQPLPKVQITGAFFQGENTAGLGGIRQGFTVFDIGKVRPVHATGGWTQASLQATQRLTFNAYGGQESNRPSDLLAGQITRNFFYAANTRYRFGPNVLLGFEMSQVRTRYLGSFTRLNNHYDLALAYLF